MEAATKRNFLELENQAHSTNIVKNLCSLMESQSLADILIFCGKRNLRAHKFVLAANSPYFREEFEKNPNIKNVIMGGMDFAVIKCLVEYIYSGRTIIPEEHFKYFKAAVKLLKIQRLEKCFLDDGSTDDIYFPQPQFLTEAPTITPTSNTVTITSNTATITSNTSSITSNTATVTNGKHQEEQNAAKSNPLFESSQENEQIMQILPTHGPRRANLWDNPVLMHRVEQTFRREALPSRLALTQLPNQIGSSASPQIVNFIAEDTCDETFMETQENLLYLEIPHHMKSKENPKSNSFDKGTASGKLTKSSQKKGKTIQQKGLYFFLQN